MVPICPNALRLRLGLFVARGPRDKVADESVVQDVAVVPEFLNDGVAGHCSPIGGFAEAFFGAGLLTGCFASCSASHKPASLCSAQA